MTANPQIFRAVFSEFCDVNTYSDIALQFWLTEGYNELNATRFGTSLDLAVMLFAAHNVVLGARAGALAQFGGDIGAVAAPMASKTVGPVSTSYDLQAALTEGGGIYNTTSYGQRLMKMFQTFCGGPVYRSPRVRPFGIFFPLIPS
jgi:hypothetical protein